MSLKYRFDEIITTINLLPDSEDIDEDTEVDPVFPNLTRDLHEPELYTAIICQTLKGDVEFRQKMSMTLANSAMNSVIDNEKVTEDDMYALAIAANILWAAGHARELFGVMGVISRLSTQFDVEIPELALAFLHGNKKAHRFSKLDPYKLLSGDYDLEEVFAETGATDDLIKTLRGIIHEESDEG